jgi:Mannosyltransferase (PIG-V)
VRSDFGHNDQPRVTSLPADPTPPPPPIPWWVNLLDTLTIAAAVIVLSNVLFDGVRLRAGELHLTATSVVRDAVICAALLGLRWWLYRPRPVWQRVIDWGRGAWESEARQVVFAPWLASRFMVLVIGYLAVVFFGYPGNGVPPTRISKNEVINLPMRWDAGWYLGIALDGYEFSPNLERQQNVAFFPAYPMLVRVGAALLGGRIMSASEASGVNKVEYAYAQHRGIVLSATIISLAAFLWALVYLYRFGRELLDERSARVAVLVACAYPFSLFFSAFYTESLFFLTMLGAFYHFRRQEWLPAAAWGLILGLTRPNGCLLSIPLAVLALQQAWKGGRQFDRNLFLRGLITASLPGIGMLLFSWYLGNLTGRPFVWLQAHQAWGRVYEGIDTLFAYHLGIIANEGLYAYSKGLPTDMLNGIATVGALLAVWPVTRRVGVAYGVLMLLMVLPPLARGGFMSMGRVTSTLFPLFLYLGWRLHGMTRDTVLMASAGLQAFFAALFFTWRPLF